MFISTLRWRQSFDVEGAMKEQYPEEIFGGLGKIYGKDKQGRPVVYNLYGATKDTGAFNDVQRFLRWRVAFMEQSIALLDFETVDQTVQIHDYEGVGLFDRTEKSKRAASEATSIFQGHYPELLARKFFVNVPSFMTWIFWLFKPLISSATLDKMAVVGSGPRTIGAALLPIIDEHELPKRYGGSAEGF
ncbi:CRAL-TRIO domain-containing protein [Pisolithus thermaeus]|nr:CRAL-TRIO domain-containing protein [Pisolithus thermaeus]